MAPDALLQLFINNKFVEAKSGKKIPVVDPRNEEAIFDVDEASPEDVDAAVRAASDAYKTGHCPNTPATVGYVAFIPFACLLPVCSSVKGDTPTTAGARKDVAQAGGPDRAACRGVCIAGDAGQHLHPTFATRTEE